jgi:hypothetical protein
VRTNLRDLHFVGHHIQTAGTSRRRTAAACKHPLPVCDAQVKSALGGVCSVSRLRTEDKKPLQLYLSLFALTVCNRTVTVNTAPLWSLQNCIKPSCVCLQCYFRHISAFACPSSGKLFICSTCSYYCIVRSLAVGYCWWVRTAFCSVCG